MTTPVALVTGASRGIGKQLCADLAGAGYDVVLVARSASGSPSKLPGTIDDTAALVEKAGRRAMPVALDVRDEAAVHALADRVFQELGRLDVLVNNAAVAVPGPALPDASKRWRLAFDVNVHGPFYLMQAFCPRMPEGGRVVNISSLAVHMPEFGRPSYSASKAALESMTQCLGHELRDRRVAVNCLRLDLLVWSEGFTFTLGGDVPPDMEHPVIMSDALLWLLQQPPDYTGQIIPITDLRTRGIVRPFTPASEADSVG